MTIGKKLFFHSTRLVLPFFRTFMNSGFISDLKKDELPSTFILSTGRTGTHFFSHFFKENFQGVHALHEPGWDIFDINREYLLGNIQHEEAVDLLALYRMNVLRKVRKEGFEYYVESNPNIAYMVPVIRSLFPQCRIVHIVRNGIDYVRSMYSRRHNLKKGKGLAFTPKDSRKRLRADYFPDDPYSDKWEEIDRFQRICWNWTKKDGLIREQVKKDPQARTFKFEDLFLEKKPKVWKELITFMEVEDLVFSMEDALGYVGTTKSNQVADYKIGDWADWPEEKKKAFVRIAGEHMQEYGYLIPEW